MKQGVGEAPWVDVQHRQKIHAIDKVHCDVCRVVLLKNLVNLNNVGMFEFGEPQRLTQKVANDTLVLIQIARFARAHLAVDPATNGTGEALFDDNMTVQAIAGQIGHAEPTVDQVTLNRVLAVQQRTTG